MCPDGVIASACMEMSWGFWIRSGALIVSALTFIVGVVSLIINSKHSKQRATVDLIIRQRDDSEYLPSVRTIMELHKKNRCATEFPELMTPGSPEGEALKKVLNEQELIAVGIREKAFNEEIYKQMQYTGIVNLWNATEKMVYFIRKQRQSKTIYRDFERLAKKWKANPLRPIDD